MVDVVEVAYQAARRSPTTWTADVLTAMTPLLDRGRGVVAYDYDTTRPLAAWVSTPVGDPVLARGVVEAFADTPPAINDWVHRRAGPVTILSELLSAPISSQAALAPHGVAMATNDMFGMNASDPSGRGTFFCALSRSLIRCDDRRRRRWQELAAHVAAAGRLRGALTAPAAVLAPDGRVLHATAAAEASLPALARAARTVDRARVARDDDALASWRALVDGRWSLIDEVEHDGRRILLVHANPPGVLDPRRLTATERLVAGYAVMGHGNKLIAYDLGLSISAVAGHLRAVCRKLGVHNRVELVDRYLLLTRGAARPASDDDASGLVAVGAPVASPPPPPTGLTVAELAVAREAARGRSTAAIARARGVAERTVANQLAGVYRKLAIGSRSELARRLAGGPPR